MEENNMSATNSGKSMFTVRNVLRALSLFCIIFVFCPSFLVSCSGQDVKVSVMTAVGGVSAYGEKVVDPHPIMLLCLFLPIAILVLLFIKKFADNKTALIILICSIVDFVIWLIFRSSVKKVAEENLCEFKTTAWFICNIIALILIILLTVLVVLKKMQIDSDFISVFSGGGTQSALNQMSSAVTKMSSAVTKMAGDVASNIGNKAPKEDVIGFCSKCGSPIVYGCRFCTSCGAPVPEGMLAEAEAARKEAEEKARLAEEAARKEAEEKARLAEEAARKEAEEKARLAEEANRQDAQITQGVDEKPKFCQQCGAKLKPDAAFCDSCGKKIG